MPHKPLRYCCLDYSRGVAKKPNSASTSKSPLYRGGPNASGALIQNRLQSAIEMHQRGEFQAAESAYLEILDINHQHFDALQLLGTLYAQTNRFSQAVNHLERALRVQSNNANVLNNLGFAYKEVKEFKFAIESFNKAVALRPDYAEAYNNRGNAFKDCDLLAQAMSSYQLSIIYSPQNAEAYYNLSQIYYDSCELSKALAGYNCAISINPYYVEAYTNQSLILCKMELWEQSLSACNQALSIRANHPQALNNKGTVLVLLGRVIEGIECFKEAYYYAPYFVDPLVNLANALKDIKNSQAALEVYTRALIVQPSCFAALLNRAILLKESGQEEWAIQDYGRAIKVEPLRSEAFFNRGNLYKDLKAYQLAIQDYEVALTKAPLEAPIFNNRGNAWSHLGDRKKARADYERSIELDPGYSNAYNNLGVFLHEEMELESAKRQLSRAAHLDPTLVDPLWNSGLILLLQGQLREGFELFEVRWKNPRLGLSPDPTSLNKPLWLGRESIRGRTILLYCEQGLGDTLHFSRYALSLLQLGAIVSMRVQAPLLSLFKSSNLGVDVFSSQEEFESKLQTHELLCPLMSLPLALLNYSNGPQTQHPGLALNPSAKSPRSYSSEMNADPIPPPIQLNPPHSLVDHWQQVLSKRCKSKYNRTSTSAPSRPLRVGIAWSGSVDHWNDHKRSIAFKTFISNLPTDHTYVSLQKEIRGSDALDFNAALENPALNLIDLRDELGDFTDTCAVLKCLDLVICVDTSVAHLSGSMGIQTHLLIPYSPDWRWLTDRPNTPWYPSIKLHRQQSLGEWSKVLMNLAKEIKDL